MNNSFLSLAQNDLSLILSMKQTIEYQVIISNKRKNLLTAISHNVKYLAVINEENSTELKLTKEKLQSITDWNEKLQDENSELQKENAILKNDQKILAQKREQMAKMIIES